MFSPLQRLDGHYPVLVLGADPTAALVASLLARTGQRVGVLAARPPGDTDTDASARLLDARHHGACLFSGIDVRACGRRHDQWLVDFDAKGAARSEFSGPLMFVSADVLVLGPGVPPALVAQARATSAASGLLVLDDPATAPAAVAEFARAAGWTSSDEPINHTPIAATRTVGLVFTEAMRGAFSTKVKDRDYGRGVRQGQDDGSRFEFVLTIGTDNLQSMIDAVDHPGRSIGTVAAPALAPEPLMVTGGEFFLFVPQADGSQRMRYRMTMVTRDGRTFFVDGFKIIRDDPGFDLWADTTTLYITVFDGPTDAAPVLGCGILHIAPADFLHQLAATKAVGARNALQELRAKATFLRLFAGTLFETYADLARYLPDVRPKGGILRALGALMLAAVLAAVLAWPFRPTWMRQEPEIAAALPDGGQLPLVGFPAPEPFPQYLRGLDLTPGSYAVESLHLHAQLPRDFSVQTHGMLAPIPLHPPDVAALLDLPLRRGYLALAHLAVNGSDAPTAIGSQVETVALDSNPLRRDVRAHTTWTIMIPDRGTLFLAQKEGGPDIGRLQIAAQKQGQPWRGEEKINHTLGPVEGGRGLVLGGTGDFEGVVGVFREFNSFTMVPAEGDLEGAADLEITFVRARPAKAMVRANLPAEAVALGLPDATLTRLGGPGSGPVRVLHRRFSIDLATDIVTRTSGSRQILIAKLRDERGDVVGLGTAIRVGLAETDSEPRDASWTLTFLGAGSLFVAMDGESPGPTPAGTKFNPPGYLGGHRGIIVGGTGIHANAAGQMRESWCSRTGLRISVALVTLVTDR